MRKIARMKEEATRYRATLRHCLSRIGTVERRQRLMSHIHTQTHDTRTPFNALLKSFRCWITFNLFIRSTHNNAYRSHVAHIDVYTSMAHINNMNLYFYVDIINRNVNTIMRCMVLRVDGWMGDRVWRRKCVRWKWNTQNMSASCIALHTDMIFIYDPLA